MLCATLNHFFFENFICFLFQEEACQTAIAVSSAVEYVALIAGNVVAMSAWFTYLNKTFNQNMIAQQVRHKNRLRRMKGK